MGEMVTTTTATPQWSFIGLQNSGEKYFFFYFTFFVSVKKSKKKIKIRDKFILFLRKIKERNYFAKSKGNLVGFRIVIKN